MKTWTKILIFCVSSFLFIGCDRATKNMAKEHLKDKESVSYLHNIFTLQYVENTGAAMSLGDSLPTTMNLLLLSILPLVFLIVLFAYTIKKIKEINLLKMFSIALIFAGGIGNIIDRILYDRHVSDFMIITFKNLRTGVFNIADVCVTACVIGLLLFYKDKRKAQTFTNS